LCSNPRNENDYMPDITRLPCDLTKRRVLLEVEVKNLNPVYFEL